jgi:hypothetical protein
MPRQDFFFEPSDYPMADAFEAADLHSGQLVPAGGPYHKEVKAIGNACMMRLMGGWSWPCPMIGTGCRSGECEAIQSTDHAKTNAPSPLPCVPTVETTKDTTEATDATARHTEPTAQKPPTTTNCLQCGKPAAAMFCGVGCRSKFIAAGEAFSKRLARTTLAGSTEQTLIEE